MSFARYAPVAGGEAAVVTSTARRKLGWLSGAAIVDLESATVAQMARAHGLRFVAVRVVIDPAHREIPLSALACVSEDGETSLARLGSFLLTRPTDIPDVIRLWGDWLSARKSLVTCCDVLWESVAAMDF
jgi:adenosylhomocysteine nucleosidase